MLKARVQTALFLIAGFLAVLFWLPAPGPTLVFAVVAALAAWEWAGLMKLERTGRLLFVGLVLLPCLLAGYRPDLAFAELWAIASIFWLCVAPLWLKYRWTLAGNKPLGLALGVALIVPTWAALVALHARGAWLLLAAMALVWVADIAAYFAGRAFGRHKLAPAISPGKTWEGVAGAVVGVMLYGYLLREALTEMHRVDALVLALGLALLTALSIVGDLFESLLKRQANVKDSSQLLPGHGGVLDRIDSQISTLPLVALTLHWISR